MERAHRLQLCYSVAEQVQRHYRDQVLAIGAYGSVARGSHGPYSDIELHCVLSEGDLETTYEWSVGPWKAEVNVYSKDVVMGLASKVDVDWLLTHGAYTHVLSIYDPTDFFSRLRIAALSQADETFRQAMVDVIVGELYERIGKVRNAQVFASWDCLPSLAFELAKFGACLVGLAHRHLYTSVYDLFEESFALPGCPNGYDGLGRMVAAGDFADPRRIVEAAEQFWSGVEGWASERGLQTENELDDLLQRID
jgi:kanamycin nucleotidyltransferase